MTYLVTELIRKKRDGGDLKREELEFLVQGISTGTIPDYQISAWLMASFIRGLSPRETIDLTTLVKNSGETLNWRELSTNFKNAHFADKHSTGGVGDKVSLVLAPLAVCLGMKVPMMSGRGLGHTGGTVDKLQSIPGFDIFPTKKRMTSCLEEVGICMMAQSEALCPADKKLYALRDVTSTIENISLITVSIVSKKWAEGVDSIVFDVKCGEAAFMQSLAEARALSESLVKTATGVGMKAHATITRMEEPLGSMVGNALEVRECVWILKNTYPSELHKNIARPLLRLCCELTARMAILSGLRTDLASTISECENFLKDGRAWSVFEKMCIAQGVAPSVAADLEKHLSKTNETFVWKAKKGGYISAIHSRELGLAGLEVGVGRKITTDTLTPDTGFELMVSKGAKVEAGQALLKAHLRNEKDFFNISSFLEKTFEIHPTPTHQAKGELDSLVLDNIGAAT